jgi:hypothetical protein
MIDDAFNYGDRIKLPKTIKTKKQALKALALGVNIGLVGSGYQVRLRKSDCVVENEEGEFLYRARSLSAAVDWIHSQQDIKVFGC